MTKQKRIHPTRYKSSLLCAAALALAGCGDGASLPAFLQPNASEESPAPAGQSVLNEPAGNDVERPDIFQAMTDGLWDGRPSLGGIWVAHPEVTQPERVIIRNTTNGNSVVGALFRKERDTPGPLLQVSSEAAEELGMLAGQPAALDVTALRPAETPDPEDADTPTEGLDAAPEISAEPLDAASTDASTDAAAAAAEALENP